MTEETVTLGALFLQDDEAGVKRAFETMLKYVTNVIQNAQEPKYHKIRISNAAFQVLMDFSACFQLVLFLSSCLPWHSRCTYHLFL